MRTSKSTRFFYLALLSLGILFSSPAFAGIIKQIASRAGAAPSLPIQKTQPALALSLFDQEYGFMVTHPLSSGTPWTNTFNVPFIAGSTTHRRAYNNVVLRYDESRGNRHTSAWSIKVDYEIKCWEWNQSTGTFNIQTYSNESLTIDYDPATPYTDKALNRYENSFGATVMIKNVYINSVLQTGPLPSIYNDIFFDLEQETERDYVISTAPTVYSILRSNTNELEVRWNFVPGAESYDVEWVFVDINDDPSPNTTTQNKPFDFHNATRINVPDQFYKISLAYPKGILLFRVRGVAAAPLSADDYSLRQEGTWSFLSSSWSGSTSTDAPYSAGVSDAYRYDVPGMHPYLTWQYSASYAEDGKRKEVVSFYDGTLRNRQSLTIGNSEQTAIVGEVKYDYDGRAAVNVLPTPVTSQGIKYYNNFNPNFDRAAFDQDANVESPGMMATTSGAGYYYSSSNTNPLGISGSYTPDAEGYPYSRTRYTTDGTNRPLSISSPGSTHKTGSGKETKFFYGSTSSQDETDRLFGSEGGYSEHYRKNLTVDANGQVTVAYVDQNGRTVATALAGTTPDNLIAIDNQPTAQTYTDDLLSHNNAITGQSAMVSTVDVLCESSGTVYTFEYTLGDDQSCSDCFICKDCKYDLEIAVMDQYGNYVPGATIITNTCSPAATGNPVRCSAISDGHYKFSVTLDVGKYKVVKSLRLSESTIATYQAEFKTYQEQNLTCPAVTPIQPVSCSFACSTMCEQQYKMVDAQGIPHYYDDSGAEVSEADGLQLIADCISNNCGQQQQPLSECDLKRELLLADMSPGGQYFDNLPDRYTVDGSGNLIDNSSYDPDGWLTSHASNQTNFWTNFNTFIAGSTPCGSLSITLSDWNDVRANWHDCFAEYLITFHPEYCAYNYFCNNVICTKAGADISASMSTGFSNYLLTVNDESAAASGGLFSTFGHATNTTYDNTSPGAADLANGNETYQPFSATGTDPYFDCTPVAPLCASYAATLLDDHLSKYYPIPGTSPQKYLSIWYVIEDPAGIHLGNGSPDPATLAYFQNLHGDGTSSNIGLLYDPSSSSPIATGQITRWQFYRSVYLYYKNLIYYSGLTTSGNCPGGLLPDGDQDGYTDVTVSSSIYKGFQIRYPENPIYEVYVDNYNDILCTTDPVTEASLLQTYSNNQVITSCEATCEGYANAWIQQLEQSCSLTTAQETDIAYYLSEVCKLDCGNDHPQGSSGCSSCPGTPCSTTCTGVALISDPSIVFYDFEDVITYFTSGGCTATIVYPPTGDEGDCSCRHLDELITENFTGTPTNQDIADLINMLYAIPTSMAYTASDVAAWKTECSSATPSNADLTAVDFPSQLKCFEDEQVTPEYSAGTCECENITRFISTIGQDPNTTDGMNAIVAALNAYLSPATAVTSTDVTGWLSECSAVSPSHATLASEHLPTLLQCPVPTSTEDNIVSSTASLAQCQQNSLLSALNAAVSNYNTQLQQNIDAYTATLRSNCLNSLAGREEFTMTYTQNQYLYTLYYYDQAGNLVKTVPPEGVDLLDAAEIAQVQAYRDHPEVTTNAPVYPDHKLVTRYKYNSLQQVIEAESPDAGLVKYWYDALGRVVLSQNAKQAVYNQPPYNESGQGYSYMKYDGLGRVIESGELLHSSSQPMTRAISRDEDASISLITWISTSTDFREITYVYYDNEHNSTDVQSAYGSGWQANLRNRISSVWYIKDPSAPSSSGPDAAEYYSYDIAGNIKKLVTETNADDRLHYLGQNLKYTEYDYDLVSGNQNMISYQAGEHDQFFHKYEYDADNRLVRAYSSHNGVIWEKESKQFYYAYGTVARTETGDREVQGTDYAYTILGWLKGINSNTLTPGRDIGKDGNTGTNLNRWFAYDAAGYSLGYFTNDYKAITSSLNNATNSFTALETTETNDYIYNSADLYNGNVSRMVTDMRDQNGNAIAVLARSFHYDQLNRLKQSDAYGDANVSTNNYWSNAGTNDLNSNYQETFTYDWNDNIKSATRYGELTGTHQFMDALTYSYNYDINGRLVNNQLTKVADAATALSSDYGNDIDAGQGTNNYQYDELGNLKEDASQQVAGIEWNSQGKITKITRTNTSSKSDLEFLYNFRGQRIVKIVKPRVSGVLQTEDKWTYTVYSRDPSGNVLAVYDFTYSNVSGNNWKAKYDLKEQHIYGSGRVGINYDQQAAVERNFTATIGGNGKFPLTSGVWTGSVQLPTVSTTHLERTLGYKAYECINHLGNIISTISDRRIAMGSGSITNYFLPEVLSYTDYYAFGMSMAGRTYIGAAGQYRYSFNGKETDAESDLQDYGMRIYNPSLGKFLSVDPLTAQFPRLSPYQFAQNRPVTSVDIDGLETNPLPGTTTAPAPGSLANQTYVQSANNGQTEFYISSVSTETCTGVHSVTEDGYTGYQDELKKRQDAQCAVSGGWQFYDADASLGKVYTYQTLTTVTTTTVTYSNYHVATISSRSITYVTAVRVEVVGDNRIVTGVQGQRNGYIDGANKTIEDNAYNDANYHGPTTNDAGWTVAAPPLTPFELPDSRKSYNFKSVNGQNPDQATLAAATLGNTFIQQCIQYRMDVPTQSAVNCKSGEDYAPLINSIYNNAKPQENAALGAANYAVGAAGLLLAFIPGGILIDGAAELGGIFLGLGGGMLNAYGNGPGTSQGNPNQEALQAAKMANSGRFSAVFSNGAQLCPH